MFGMMTVRINCSSEDTLNSIVWSNDSRNSNVCSDDIRY